MPTAIMTEITVGITTNGTEATATGMITFLLYLRQIQCGR
jgi:hypothetical protein